MANLVRRNKLILFDFDGTLADSLDEAITFANVLLAKAGKQPITRLEIRNLGVKAAIKRRNVHSFQLFLFLLFSRHNLSKHIETLDLFPHIKPELIKLANKYALGIVSSNSKGNISKFLKHHGIEYCFSFIESELSLFGKHRKIKSILKTQGFNPKNTYYVGDETRDVEAAKKSDVVSIAVTWGFESQKLLKKSQPDLLISKVSEIYQYLKTKQK